MSWLTRRLDHLGSAAFGACGGLGFSQAPAFVQAYLQRLSGHIDEARRTVEQMQAGELLPWLDDTARQLGTRQLEQRLLELEALRDRLLDAPAWWRPAQLLKDADWSIARRAADDFVPAVPLDPVALLWTALGIMVAALLWDLLRVPAWLHTGLQKMLRQRRNEGKSTPPTPTARSRTPRRRSAPPRPRGAD